MSEATPKKRGRYDDDGDGDGEEGAVGVDQIHRCIQLKDPESFSVTIRQRRYWEFTHIENGNKLYLIPLNWLEFFTYGIHKNGTHKSTERWAEIDNMARSYGLKIHKAGITLHSLIPMQQSLTVQSGTSVETLAMNTTPYLEIYKDSNMTYESCKSPSDKTHTLKNWLWNPQIQEIGDAQEYEFPAGHLGTMEQYHSGQRKTYTIMPENDR